MTRYIKPQLSSVLLAAIWILLTAHQILAQKPELVVQAGHKAMIRAMALSPNNKLLASAGADNTIIIWDIVLRKQVFVLKGHNEWIFALAFSREGRLASGSYDGIVKIWNLSNFKLESEISSIKPYNITSLAFSPDGKTLAIASASKGINLWDMQAGKMKPPLQGHSDTVTQVMFLADGNTLLSSSLDKTVKTWDPGTMENKATMHLPEGVSGFAHSPDRKVFAFCLTGGKIAIFGSGEPYLIPYKGLSQSEGGIEYRHWRRLFEVPRYPPGALAFISNRELAFVNSAKLIVWDIQANEEKLSKNIISAYGAYSLIGDQQRNLLIYSESTDIKLFNRISGEESQLKGAFSDFKFVSFSSNSKALLGMLGDGPSIWTTDNRTDMPIEEAKIVLPSLTLHLRNTTGNVIIWSLGVRAAIDSENIRIQNWVTNEIYSVLKGHTRKIKRIAVNYQETRLASSSEDGTILIWDLKTRERIHKLDEKAEYLQFSPDGKYLATASLNSNTLKLWDMSDLTRKPVVINALVHQVILFSPDSEIIAAQVYEEPEGTSPPAKNENKSAEIGDQFIEGMSKRPIGLKLWQAATGQLVRSFVVETTPKDFNITSLKSTKSILEPFGWSLFGSLNFFSAAGPVAFSPDGRLIASNVINRATGSEAIKIWDVSTGGEAYTFRGHTSLIRAVAFSPNGKLLASGGWDKTLRLWSLTKGQEVATLIPFNRLDWVVFTPEGLFDTNLYLDNTTSLTWIWPDDALHPLSLGVFLRDYYEPKLLSRILANEELRTVRDLSTVDRTQPLVNIREIKPDGADTVQVTVEVANVFSNVQHDAKGKPLQSGVFDVRLFRDRKLVGSSTTEDVLSGYVMRASRLEDKPESVEQELNLWREANKVMLDADGKAKLTFNNISLPVGEKELVFSAYAFNSERVLSEPSTYAYKPQPVSAKMKRRAYVITVGVDANQPGWELDFAAKSAQDIGRILHDKLSGKYEVINVELLATHEPYSPRLAYSQATKENIHNVLSILAGKTISLTQRTKIPNGSALRRATPDDLVVLYISSHGFADPNGTFYVIPYNVGKPTGVTASGLNDCFIRSIHCDGMQTFLSQSISSNDFAVWWRGVDAGEIVLILDSCYSAAVSGRDFKPGPLGDRNFGQLAYDKGMIILSATQKDQLARSAWRKGIQGTLLSSALDADWKAYPQSPLSSWLKSPEYRVPDLYRRLYPKGKEEEVQYPVFFDFTKRRKLPIGAIRLPIGYH